MNRVLAFLWGGRAGLIAGMLYSILSFFLFFYGLGYYASCPDAFPCNPLIIDLLSASDDLIFPHAISWQLLGFFGGGLLFGLFQGNVAAVGIVAFASVVTLLWGLIGAVAQHAMNSLVRTIRKRLKTPLLTLPRG